MLANVNLMSMFGLHRSLRGSLVGHFAAAEISTAPSAQRMIAALIAFGIRATEELEGRFGRSLLDRWRAGESSLHRPL